MVGGFAFPNGWLVAGSRVEAHAFPDLIFDADAIQAQIRRAGRGRLPVGREGGSCLGKHVAQELR